MLDERKTQILCAVIEEYIRSGEPVGSNSVLSRLGVKVSSATVRNDMSVLEQLGFLEQPHTSAGRIPTYLGYRYYIDNLIMVKPLSAKEKHLIDSMLKKGEYTGQAVIDNAVNALSELTQLAAVSKSNMPTFSVITRVEVIPAGRRLYALLIITSAGTIKNKICRVEFDLDYQQLEFFEKFINENLKGIQLEKMTPAMLQNLAVAMGGYMMTLSPLLTALYELSAEISNSDINLKGEQKLIESGVKADDVVNLITHKNELDELLSRAFDGIMVVFGKEKGNFAITNSSMILSPYKVGDKQAGSLGVIGPVRLNYAEIIPHIQYITNSITKMLNEVIEKEDVRKEDNGEDNG